MVSHDAWELEGNLADGRELPMGRNRAGLAALLKASTGGGGVAFKKARSAHVVEIEIACCPSSGVRGGVRTWLGRLGGLLLDLNDAWIPRGGKVVRAREA